MPRTLQLVAIGLSVATSVSPAQTTRPRPSAASIAQAVDRLAQRAMDDRLTAALGVAIVMDGRIIFQRAYGMADATAGIRADTNSLWYVASTTKSFTGMAVSLLVRQGVIDLRAPITTLLPNARWHADAKPNELTLVHFLTHTMGLDAGAVVMAAAFTGLVPEARWPQLLEYSRPLPTREMAYNNLGYNVAAMVIDAKRPEGWRRYLDSAVFLPVGMCETYHRVSGLDRRRIAKPHDVARDLSFVTLPFRKDDVTMNAAGGHLATLSDLARWTIVNMQDGMIDGRQALNAEAVRAAHTQLAEHTRDASRTFGPFRRTGWGVGWDIGFYEDEPMVSRFGGYETTRSHLSYLPARRIGFVALTTSATGSPLTDVLATYAYDLEAGRPDALARAEARLAPIRDRHQRIPASLAAFDSVTRSRNRPLAQPLANFAGRYTHPGYGGIVFTISDGALWYAYGAYSGKVDVYDADRNQFRLVLGGGGSIVTFAMDDRGRPKYATFAPDMVFTRMDTRPVP